MLRLFRKPSLTSGENVFGLLRINIRLIAVASVDGSMYHEATRPIQLEAMDEPRWGVPTKTTRRTKGDGSKNVSRRSRVLISSSATMVSGGRFRWGATAAPRLRKGSRSPAHNCLTRVGWRLAVRGQSSKGISRAASSVDMMSFLSADHGCSAERSAQTRALSFRANTCR